jgi:hypothetical protein
MTRGDKRALALLGGVALVTLVAEQPTANIRLLTHDRTDPAPHVMKVAADLGVVGVSLLYTWTVDSLR